MNKGEIIVMINDERPTTHTVTFCYVNKKSVSNSFKRCRNRGSRRSRKLTAKQDAALINNLRANPFSTLVQATHFLS